MKTLTRAQISDAICEQIGLSRRDASDILDMVFEEIKAELANGHDVKIATFGSFCLHQKDARVGRNPKTGKEAEISARTVVSFRASKVLRKAVNKIG